MNGLFAQLQALQLPTEDFAVFGSGPLLVRGLIPHSNDLDVICRGAAWQRVKLSGTLSHDDTYNVDIVSMYDEQLTFGTKWGIGDFEVDRLIEDAEFIGDIPFVRLEHVAAYKRARNSPKDRQHIQAMGAANLLDFE